MAIDTSIYARIQPPQIESPVNTLAQMMQLQGAQQANQMNALKMAEAQRGIERQNQLRALAGGFTQEMTPEQQVGALTRGGFFEEAKTLGESAAKIAKDRREAEKFQISNARDRLSMAGQLLGGVKDQASYDQARQTALASGFDANQIPEQYNPQWVEQARARALTSEQQLEQIWKQKGYDLDVEKFGETKRHQRAQEGLTARGQNLADARAREANLAMREAQQTVYDPERGMLVNKATGLARPAATFDGKQLPDKATEAQKKEMMSINQQKSILQGAIDAVEKTPDAFSLGRGVAGKLPLGESIAGRSETPAQTQARAYVFNNVSRIINERAGAAQSAQELARLQTFLPADTDNATQIKNKLEGFKRYLQDLESGTRGDVRAPAPTAGGGFKYLGKE